MPTYTKAQRRNESDTIVNDLVITLGVDEASNLKLFEEIAAAFPNNGVSYSDDKIVIHEIADEATTRTLFQSEFSNHDKTQKSADEYRSDTIRNNHAKIDDIGIVIPLVDKLNIWKNAADKNRESTGKRFSHLVTELNRTPAPQRSIFISALEAEEGVQLTITDGRIVTLGITAITRQATLRFTVRQLTYWNTILNA